jgi:hypothetical protein
LSSTVPVQIKKSGKERLHSILYDSPGPQPITHTLVNLESHSEAHEICKKWKVGEQTPRNVRERDSRKVEEERKMTYKSWKHYRPNQKLLQAERELGVEKSNG